MSSTISSGLGFEICSVLFEGQKNHTNGEKMIIEIIILEFLFMILN
jgi:hypothetical protein